MALPLEFLTVLRLLGRACVDYQRMAGAQAVLVGGAAVCLFTDGEYLSGDFDVVATAADTFEAAITARGFRKEDRPGFIPRGYYHCEFTQFAIELVSGALFDGLADATKLVVVQLEPEIEILVASVEDLIADRLGQFAASNGRDRSLLEQAKLLFELAGELDEHYLQKRILDDGGDPSLL